MAYHRADHREPDCCWDIPGPTRAVPTHVGVNREAAVQEAALSPRRRRRDCVPTQRLGCPHARGGEPRMAFRTSGRAVEELSPRTWG